MCGFVARRCIVCRKAPAIPGRDYCSWACRDGGDRWDLRQCAACLKPVRTARRDAEYCSNACRQKAYRAQRDWLEDQEAKAEQLRAMLTPPA
jgi:hypothetical protein